MNQSTLYILLLIAAGAVIYIINKRKSDSLLVPTAPPSNQEPIHVLPPAPTKPGLVPVPGYHFGYKDGDTTHPILVPDNFVPPVIVPGQKPDPTPAPSNTPVPIPSSCFKLPDGRILCNKN